MKRVLIVGLIILQAVSFGRQSPATSQMLQDVQSNTVNPKSEKVNYPALDSISQFGARYAKPTAPELPLGPADRARPLIHNGAIYLSLHDAIALAIENNLDVEVARYSLTIAGTETLRASGGGNLRGVDYAVQESPTGVGGPGSPLLNSAASTVTPTTPTVNDLTSLNILSEAPSNLSVQGTAGYAAGPTVPTLQPTLVGQSTYFNRRNSTLLTAATT
ncbi:MAG: TolC family protein, partial [Acidobacteriaceae bacterium]|nr:TolC family protein [Acidobacteriaceae bacterium]